MEHSWSAPHFSFLTSHFSFLISHFSFLISHFTFHTSHYIMTDQELELLIHRILQCAYNVRTQLCPGFLEEIYKKALLIELSEAGIEYEHEVPFCIYYKGHAIGQYRADLVVANQIIIEIKATSSLVVANEIQLVNYLTATGLDTGLLINFGNTESLQIKRKYRVYKVRNEK